MYRPRHLTFLFLTYAFPPPPPQEALPVWYDHAGVSTVQGEPKGNPLLLLSWVQLWEATLMEQAL